MAECDKGCDRGCPEQTPNRASGPKWGKNGRKMDFGATGAQRKKWPKNGRIGPKMGKKSQFSHFSAIFPPFFPVGPKSIFRPFFPISGRRPDLGSVQGNRSCKTRAHIPSRIANKRFSVSENWFYKGLLSDCLVFAETRGFRFFKPRATNMTHSRKALMFLAKRLGKSIVLTVQA